MKPFLTLCLLAPLLPLAAQTPKPVDPVPTHKPEQSTLNSLKQDARNKDSIQKAKDLLEKKLQQNEAARKELERLKKEDTTPSTEEAKKRLEKMTGEVDDADLKELKNMFKDSREALEDDVRKAAEALREKNRREGKMTPANPSPEIEAPSGGFDAIPSPEALPKRKAPVFGVPPIKAQRMIKAPSRDPKNPDKELPDSDPRTRTYILSGNVTIRRPGMALDADEVDILFRPGAATGAQKKAPSGDKPPGGDPVKASNKDSSPFERIVARGRVRFMFVDKTGRVQVGRGGYMVYEEKSGWFIIKDWPEAEFAGKLLRGPSKNSVIRMSRLEEADVIGCQFFTMERELTEDDLPRTPDQPVPAAAAILPSGAEAPNRPPATAPR
jgi:hypothetical protein